MIPRIKRMGKGWIAGTEENGYDLCDTFRMAVRYWLWHCGVPQHIAFGWFKRKGEYIPPFLFKKQGNSKWQERVRLRQRRICS